MHAWRSTKRFTLHQGVTSEPGSANMKSLMPFQPASCPSQLSLTVPELHKAACALAKEKAPGPDGISVDFFTLFWPLIGVDFHQMI